MPRNIQIYLQHNILNNNNFNSDINNNFNNGKIQNMKTIVNLLIMRINILFQDILKLQKQA